MSIYDDHLDRGPANFVALTPVSFVERSAEVFGDLENRLHQVELQALLGDLLHSRRAGLDAEVQRHAAGLGHLSQELRIHAVHPGRCTPAVVERLTGC